MLKFVQNVMMILNTLSTEEWHTFLIRMDVFMLHHGLTK